MNNISNFIIPLLVLFVIIYALKNKVNIYDEFIKGSKDSIKLSLEMFPCLLAMILGINLFVNSNFLHSFLSLFDNFFKIINVPSEIIPLAIMRPISGSSSLALLNDILNNYGPDSYIGRLASVIQGSTETTLYVITLYFGSVGIKKIKYALWAGLLSDLIGIIAAIFLVKFLF